MYQSVSMRRPAWIAMTAYLVVMSAVARADGTFWLSPVGEASAPPSSGSTPNLVRPLNAPGTIHVWVQLESDESLSPKPLANFSLNLTSSDDTVLEFTQIEIHNQLSDGTKRFEFVFDSFNGLNLADQAVCFPDVADPTSLVLPAEALWGIRGFTVSPGGAVGLGGNSANDPNYDSLNNAWRLATVSYQPLQEGVTELFLQIGEVGMNHPGETTTVFDAILGDPLDGTLNAESDRCVSSATSESSVTVTAPLLGDFNNSGVLDGGDIDLLSAEVLNATDSATFDLTATAEVNADDRDFWVEILADTFYGDADFDKTVDFGDFLTLSANYLMAGTWSSGDFSGDQLVNFADFLLLSDNYLNTNAVAVAVPEPNTAGLLVVGAISVWALAVGRCKRAKGSGSGS